MGLSSPKAPDPVATASAQSSMNRDTAQSEMLMNMVNQVGPAGSLNYDQTGNITFTDSNGRLVTIPQFTATTSYSPGQQAIYDQTEQAQQNLAGLAVDQSAAMRDYLQTPFQFEDTGPDYSRMLADMGDFQFNYNDPGLEGWAYDIASSRVLPQMERNRDALRTQLINSGIRPGSDAWNAEMTRMDQADTDQINQLALEGRSLAMQDRSQQFGEQLASRGASMDQIMAGLSDRSNRLNEAMATRSQPINELSALLSGSQVASPTLGFAGAPQVGVGGVDYTGLVNNQYNAQLANRQSMMGGLFGSAAALLGNTGLF